MYAAANRTAAVPEGRNCALNCLKKQQFWGKEPRWQVRGIFKAAMRGEGYLRLRCVDTQCFTSYNPGVSAHESRERDYACLA